VRPTVRVLMTFLITTCFVAGRASAIPNALPRASLMHSLGACSITVSPFSFSNFSPTTQSGRFAQGTITFNCPAGVASIALSSGNSNQFRTREMVASSDPRSTLSYNIYLDSGLSIVFGDGSGGSAAYLPAANASRGSFPIYGEIARNNLNLRISNYSDSLRLTVNMTP
jgi:spore coat protein U-like protein